MAVLTMYLATTMNTTNPIMLSIIILMMSLFMSLTLFKVSLASWLSFVVILTFSSGMMTLFMYTASLSSNETNSKTKWPVMIMTSMMVMFMMPNMKSSSVQKESMKMFSNNTLMLVTGTILIMTMLSISTHGHHPNQTVSSSF